MSKPVPTETDSAERCNSNQKQHSPWTEDNTGVLDPGALDIIRRIKLALPPPPAR